MAPNFIKNPQMLALQIKSIYENSAPLFLEPIIEEGVADGSISTAYPKELSEVLLLLINIWLAPVAHEDGSAGMAGRIGFFGELLEKLGLPIFDADTYKRIEEMAALYDSKDHSPSP